jgi:4-alpha-glucanotransferase
MGDGVWHGEIERVSSRKPFEYTYELERDSQVVRREWKGHTLSLPAGLSARTVTVVDRWNDRPADAHLYSNAFTKAIFSRSELNDGKSVRGANVVFQVNAPDVRPGEVLAMAGSGKALGDWSSVLPFDDTAFPCWTLEMNVEEPFAYKIIVADRETLAPVRWEEGENRWFGNVPQEDEVIVEASAGACFGSIPWKGAGTAIPVFSIRTEEDFGVGEFYDLKKMVDWAASTGQVMIQLLPINDTTMFGTWEDSYPYNPNSTFALHPQYLHLPAAGVDMDEEYMTIQKELNSLPTFDYEKVNQTKIALLRKAFAKTFRKLSMSDTYQSFIEKNGSWLLPYAAFCVLRDLNGTPDFSRWKAYSKYNKKKVAAFCEENKSEVDFWCFIQYHLDKQLSEVCAYAHSKGVVFKGDLPIGISRTSVDAWLYP